ncbi:hypothetical protein A3860_37940 [Niastella vici]|uniref:Uncharacterized protein n=1 Tax=Niastella vici TaxID=1703345 RepID=A0A1V9FMC2_9BACT|nr:hypothetical protein A3860_37940 [Niastella vici]
MYSFLLQVVSNKFKYPFQSNRFYYPLNYLLSALLFNKTSFALTEIETSMGISYTHAEQYPQKEWHNHVRLHVVAPA